MATSARGLMRVTFWALWICVTVVVAGWIYAHLRSTNEDRIFADLARLSQAQPANFLSGFGHVCFNFNVANVRGEFSAEAARLKLAFAGSMNQCGILGNSCCNIHSDSSGVIGLVSGDNIECIKMEKHIFWTDRAMCLKPSEMAVQRKAFTEITGHRGRPGRYAPGQTYYEISASGR